VKGDLADLSLSLTIISCIQAQETVHSPNHPTKQTLKKTYYLDFVFLSHFHPRMFKKNMIFPLSDIVAAPLFPVFQ